MLPFLGIGMRIDLFQSCGHSWVYQICWHIESSTLIASSFRVLNSPTGIPSHPLALLTTVLPKGNLTSHSRMSGSEWLTTPLWLSGSLGSFFVMLFHKKPAWQFRRLKRHRFNIWVRKFPWRRAWQPTLVFLPGEAHEQMSLMGYSPWGRKESDMTEAT